MHGAYARLRVSPASVFFLCWKRVCGQRFKLEGLNGAYLHEVQLESDCRSLPLSPQTLQTETFLGELISVKISA